MLLYVVGSRRLVIATIIRAEPSQAKQSGRGPETQSLIYFPSFYYRGSERIKRGGERSEDFGMVGRLGQRRCLSGKKISGK